MNEAIAGDIEPPLELNATEYVSPDHRAYKIVSAVGMNGDDTVVPVEVLDQPKNVYPTLANVDPELSVNPVVP